jgi:hypothetical protein
MLRASSCYKSTYKTRSIKHFRCTDILEVITNLATELLEQCIEFVDDDVFLCAEGRIVNQTGSMEVNISKHLHRTSVSKPIGRIQIVVRLGT